MIVDVKNQTLISTELKHLVDTYESWPKLRSFRLSTGNHADLTLIGRFLGKCPRIENFELNWTSHSSNFNYMKKRGVLKAEDVPELPTLTHFATTNFTHRLIVPMLLAKMPNLKDLTFHGYFDDFDESDPDEGVKRFFDALQGLKKLEKIHWLTTDLNFEFPTRIISMPTLRALSEILEEYDSEMDELELIVSSLVKDGSGGANGRAGKTST